jgi:hypothetical protein
MFTIRPSQSRGTRTILKYPASATTSHPAPPPPPAPPPRPSNHAPSSSSSITPPITRTGTPAARARSAPAHSRDASTRATTHRPASTPVAHASNSVANVRPVPLSITAIASGVPAAVARRARTKPAASRKPGDRIDSPWITSASATPST